MEKIECHVQEQECREAFLNWTLKNRVDIWDIDFRQDEYDSVDCCYFSASSIVICELKKRKHSYKMNWPGQPEGFIFESIKYDAMMASGIRNKQFIVIFEDAVVVWDIDELKYKKFNWMYKMLSKNRFCREKVLKCVTYLTLEMASHIYKK